MLQQQQQQQHQQQAIQNQIAGQNSMHIQSQMQGQARPMKNMPVSAMKAPPTQPGARQMQSGSIRPQDFMKQLLDFMQSKGTPILNIPKIGDNSVDLFRLFSIIMRMGGSRKVNTLGQWPAVVAGVGLSLETSPTVVEELREIFSKCLGSFESAWIQKSLHHNQQSQQQQHPQQGMQPAVQSHNQMLSGPPKAVPSNIPIDQGSSQVQPVQNAVPPQTPVKNPNQGDPRQHNGSGPAMNPPITPQNQQIHSQSSNTPNRMLTQSSPLSQTPFGFSPTLSSNSKSNMILASDIGNLEALQQPVKEEVSTNFKPKVRGLDTHGGVDVAVLSTIGWELNFYKPTVPTFSEHGVIDIHALTMSLKSGLTSEVRLALDTLATVSVESRWSLSLESCEDLVETLVDVAESEVGLLAKHVEIASETIRIPAYEDVMRGCRSETETLMDVPKFGSLAHRLEKAADKLICITTIFRNLSFFESNHAPLAEKNVVTFLSGVIRLLGTRYMLLRTYANTLDFLKDMIIYLSNLSQTITLPSKDEAANLLHLILAFAPQPCPTMSSSSGLMFASYQPSIHRYLPPAVDSLAKLLARDEPNRSFYRTIFLSEGASTKKYDLMTRSFGLAISPIPDNTRNILPQTVEARKPFLEQGMLAAEIIAGMAPGSEDGLAKSWLTSEDGFALSLLRLVCLLSPHSTHFPTRPQPGKMPNPEETQPFSRITHRGMGVLQKLAEKSEDPSDPVSRLPLGILPKKESLLGALLTVQIDGAIVKQLCTYAGLND